MRPREGRSWKPEGLSRGGVLGGGGKPLTTSYRLSGESCKLLEWGPRPARVLVHFCVLQVSSPAVLCKIVCRLHLYL